MPEKRGHGHLNVDPANPLTHFREATWEEALAAAAGGLSELRAKTGTTVAGFGSAKCSNEEAYLFQKLIRHVVGEPGFPQQYWNYGVLSLPDIKSCLADLFPEIGGVSLELLHQMRALRGPHLVRAGVRCN